MCPPHNKHLKETALLTKNTRDRLKTSRKTRQMTSQGTDSPDFISGNKGGGPFGDGDNMASP
jgi:hypothetical protein